MTKRNKSKTDWDRVLNTRDEDIDFSDSPEMTDFSNMMTPDEMFAYLKEFSRKKKEEAKLKKRLKRITNKKK